MFGLCGSQISGSIKGEKSQKSLAFVDLQWSPGSFVLRENPV